MRDIHAERGGMWRNGFVEGERGGVTGTGNSAQEPRTKEPPQRAMSLDSRNKAMNVSIKPAARKPAANTPAAMMIPKMLP